MNVDLTFNTIAFKKSYDTKDESVRQSTARAVNTPDLLTIKSQDAVDSATKVAGRRYTIRIDRVNLDTNGVRYVTSAYAVIVVPLLASQADVDNVIATFKAAMADATLVSSVLNNEK